MLIHNSDIFPMVTRKKMEKGPSFDRENEMASKHTRPCKIRNSNGPTQHKRRNHIFELKWYEMKWYAKFTANDERKKENIIMIWFSSHIRMAWTWIVSHTRLVNVPRTIKHNQITIVYGHWSTGKRRKTWRKKPNIIIKYAYDMCMYMWLLDWRLDRGFALGWMAQWIFWWMIFFTRGIT